jgi:hypothetical protein
LTRIKMLPVGYEPVKSYRNADGAIGDRNRL